MKSKKKLYSALFRLAVLAWALIMGVQFANLRMDIAELKADNERLETEISAKTTVNEDLEESIRKGGSDESIAKIARDKLGYTSPGEKVYKDSSEQ